MIRSVLAAAMLVVGPLPAFAAEPAASTSAPIFDLPHLQRELDNGLRVIVIRTPQKGVVSVQIPIQTGSRNEVEPGKTGFAHFFEHMMFRGTPNTSAEAYSAAIKAAGADQNAYTDDDLTNYFTNITPVDLDRILALEADRFQNLAYSEEQFRTEAQAVKGEYLKNYANPLLKGLERLQGLAYTKHTYQHTTMGLFEDIEDMPNELAYSKEFFQRWYKPEYASVIVAGDVELEPTFELIKKHFGGWKRGSFTQEIPVEPAQDAARYAHVNFDGPTLPWILAGWKAPAFDAGKPDAAAQAVLAEVFFGTSSDLYQKLVVRERWVDQLQVQPSRSRDTGLFLIALRLTAPEHAAKVVAALDDSVFAMRTRPIDAQRLADTKSRLRYQFAGGMDSAARIGATVASFVHFERDLQTLNRYYASLDRLDAGQIRATANTVFADHNRTVVSIAKAAALAGADGFGNLDARVAAAPAAPVASAEAASPSATAAAAKPLSRRQQRELELARQAHTFDLQTMQMQAGRVMLPSDSPLVDVALVFRTGAAEDPVGKKGVTALAAAMLSQAGTQSRSYEDIQRAMYPLAAPLNLQVDKDLVRIYGTVHRDNLQHWWAVVNEQITLPGLREEDFERLRGQQINNIRASLRANNDEELGKELLYERIYGPAHAYGTLTLGRVGDLQKLTIDDVRNALVSRFSRTRLIFGIAGGFDSAVADEMFASLVRLPRDDSRAPPVGPATPATQRGALIVRKETPAVAVSFGVPLSVKRGDPDWVALWLARSWLGEHRSTAGRLFDRIRELRGMNYGSYAYVEYFPNGMFRVMPEPNYARANDIFQIWIRPLRSNNDAVFATRTALYEVDQLVRKGLAPAEFERTRDFLRKFVSNLTSTQTAQLGYAIDSRVYGTAGFVDYVRKGLDELTVDKVNAAVRKHFDLRGAQFVFVAADADDLAKRLGSGAASPISYNTPKAADVQAEDKRIQALPLGLAPGRVSIVDEAKVFE